MTWRPIGRLVGLGFVLLLAVACASFRADRLPSVDAVPSQAQVSNKPSVYLALRAMRDASGGKNPAIEVPAALPELRQVVERVATEAALFRSYTFESSQAKDVDYVLQMEMTNYGNYGKAVAAGVITGLTLFIVPSAATDNYKLGAKLFDGSGQLLKTYSYDDAITTWFGIWLLPLAWKTPRSTVHDLWENMTRTLFRDILKDGVSSHSWLGPQRLDRSPRAVTRQWSHQQYPSRVLSWASEEGAILSSEWSENARGSRCSGPELAMLASGR